MSKPNPLHGLGEAADASSGGWIESEEDAGDTDSQPGSSTGDAQPDPAEDSGSPCDGPDGAFDSLEDARDLGSASCLGSLVREDGALDDADDVDWFRYEVRDNCDTAAPALLASAGSAVEVCVFADCQSGATSYICEGAISNHSANGLAGCCGEAAIGATAICTDGPGPIDVFIRLRSLGPVCVPYELFSSVGD